MRALIVACALATGCATVMAGGPDRVPVVSIPKGATVYLNGRPVGTAPVMVELDRRNQAIIQLAMPGYQTTTITRGKSMNGWFVGSLLLIVMIIPAVVDIATGDFLSFDDSAIAVRMRPMAPGPPPRLLQPQPQPQRPPEPKPQEPLPPAPYVPPRQ
jgi:hypothetical protein